MVAIVLIGHFKMSESFKKFSNSPLGTVIRVALVILGGEYLIMLAIEGVLTPIFGKQVSPVFWGGVIEYVYFRS